ncbi:hypothetical protein CEXT_690211 [Caerostris extrusa]|uniref:Uncharacterized protein n=1 Tax=Caerostris extrusa TaxID=172846 RepID=A0AAV4PMK7_CAEEX|nr:hypothetical protein CEXT_690211 [Caerostris extrusa]
MNLDLYLTCGQKFEKVLHFKLTARDPRINMSTIQLSLLNNAGGKTECVKGEVWFNLPEKLHSQLTFQTTRNRLMAAKDVYLPNDVLSVLCIIILHVYCQVRKYASRGIQPYLTSLKVDNASRTLPLR